MKQNIKHLIESIFSDMEFKDDELDIADKICGYGIECAESKAFHKIIRNFVTQDIGIIDKVMLDAHENTMHVLLTRFHMAMRVNRQFTDKVRKSGYKLKFHCNTVTPLHLQISGGSASEPNKRSTVSSYYINEALSWFSDYKMKTLTLLRFNIDDTEPLQTIIDTLDSLEVLNLQYLQLKCEPKKINVPDHLEIAFDNYTSQKIRNMFIK